MAAPRHQERQDSFSVTYSYITAWVLDGNWIELGQTEWSRSMARALDPGGLVWEGGTDSDTLDDVLAGLNTALRDWMEVQR